MPMPAILLVYKLFNAVLLCLVPKKLRVYLPSSWYTHSSQQPQQQHIKKEPPASCALLSSRAPRRMDAHELARVFQMFDRNGDGRISTEELKDSLENMGILIPEQALAQLVDKIDVNGDGCVDIDEFGELYQSIMDGRDEEEDVREAFNVFDRNGDGFITVDELKSVLGSLGLSQGRAAEDCKSMIKRVDADGDGMVNFTEFKQMMRGGALTTN